MIEIRSFRDVLRLFFIFRREFKLATLLTTLLIVLGAFLLPSSYEASARLLVQPSRENSTVPVEMSGRQTLYAPSTQRDPVVDEEKLLTGRPVSLQVAERMLLELENYQPDGAWDAFKHKLKAAAGTAKEGLRDVLVFLQILEQKPVVNRLADRLEKKFSVGHDAGSNVMELRLVWGDPMLAEKILEQWIQVYQTERAKSLDRSSLQDFYDTEIRQLDELLLDLKQQLQAHYTAIDSISIKARLENLTDQINRLSDLKSVKTNEISGLRAQLEHARNNLTAYPQEVVTEREVSLNPTMLDLRLKLNGLEEEKSILLRTYLPEAEKVRQVEQSITEMHSLIAQQKERLERSRNIAPSSIVSGLQQIIVDNQLKLDGLHSEMADIEQQLAGLTAQRQQALAAEPHITRLLLQLETAESNYALYADSQEKARIDKALADSLIGNIRIVEPATGNLGRIFPKTLYMLILALPAGLCAGLLTVYICYLLDLRIHDGSGLETRFNVPLWTSIPDLEDPSANNPAFIASLYRCIGMLPLEQIHDKGLNLALTSTHTGAGLSFIIEHLGNMLQQENIKVTTSHEIPAAPGEVALLNAGSLHTNPMSMLILNKADKHILVIEARHTTVPMLKNALSVLGTAFKQVDGIILNRRHFEVPGSVLQRLERWQGNS